MPSPKPPIWAAALYWLALAGYVMIGLARDARRCTRIALGMLDTALEVFVILLVLYALAWIIGLV